MRTWNELNDAEKAYYFCMQRESLKDTITDDVIVEALKQCKFEGADDTALVIGFTKAVKEVLNAITERD